MHQFNWIERLVHGRIYPDPMNDGFDELFFDDILFPWPQMSAHDTCGMCLMGGEL